MKNVFPTEALPLMFRLRRRMRWSAQEKTIRGNMEAMGDLVKNVKNIETASKTGSTVADVYLLEILSLAWLKDLSVEYIRSAACSPCSISMIEKRNLLTKRIRLGHLAFRSPERRDAFASLSDVSTLSSIIRSTRAVDSRLSSMSEQAMTISTTISPSRRKQQRYEYL